MQDMTFVKACSSHFGRLPGQSLSDFGAELKALGDKDRADLKAEFAKIDINVTDIL